MIAAVFEPWTDLDGARSREPTNVSLRTAAAVIGAVLVTAPVLAAVLLLADPDWRVALGELDDPAPAAAAPDGPVFVLGGGADRLPFALTLPGVPGPTRPLWVSAHSDEALAREGLSCADEHVVCAQPEPASTYGEALLLARLAHSHAALGASPDATVTVVTSTFHVPRTRYQFATCPGPEVVVVAPAAALLPGERDRGELVKLINAGLRTACRGRTSAGPGAS
jgi:hypothetical protein